MTTASELREIIQRPLGEASAAMAMALGMFNKQQSQADAEVGKEMTKLAKRYVGILQAITGIKDGWTVSPTKHLLSIDNEDAGIVVDIHWETDLASGMVDLTVELNRRTGPEGPKAKWRSKFHAVKGVTPSPVNLSPASILGDQAVRRFLKENAEKLLAPLMEDDGWQLREKSPLLEYERYTDRWGNVWDDEGHGPKNPKTGPVPPGEAELNDIGKKLGLKPMKVIANRAAQTVTLEGMTKGLKVWAQLYYSKLFWSVSRNYKPLASGEVDATTPNVKKTISDMKRAMAKAGQVKEEVAMDIQGLRSIIEGVQPLKVEPEEVIEAQIEQVDVPDRRPMFKARMVIHPDDQKQYGHAYKAARMGNNSSLIARVATVNPRYLPTGALFYATQALPKTLADAGFDVWHLGVESGKDKWLALRAKGIKVDKAARKASWSAYGEPWELSVYMKKHGIPEGGWAAREEEEPEGESLEEGINKYDVRKALEAWQDAEAIADSYEEDGDPKAKEARAEAKSLKKTMEDLIAKWEKQKAKSRASSRARAGAMRSVGMVRTRSGQWEGAAFADELRGLIEYKGSPYGKQDASREADMSRGERKHVQMGRGEMKSKKKAAHKGERQAAKKEIMARMKGENVELAEMGAVMEELAEAGMPMSGVMVQQLDTLKTVQDTAEQLGRFSTEFAQYLKKAMKREQVDVGRLGKFGRQVDAAHSIFRRSYEALLREDIDALED